MKFKVWAPWLYERYSDICRFYFIKLYLLSWANFHQFINSTQRFKSMLLTLYQRPMWPFPKSCFIKSTVKKLKILNMHYCKTGGSRKSSLWKQRRSKKFLSLCINTSIEHVCVYFKGVVAWTVSTHVFCVDLYQHINIPCTNTQNVTVL